MRLIVYLFRNVGPMTPFLLTCSVIACGVILSLMFNRLSHRKRDVHKEQMILQWVAGSSIVFGILGTLLGLRAVFPNISPGDPSASISMILSGLGHALSSSVAGLIIAVIADLGILFANLSNKWRTPCKD